MLLLSIQYLLTRYDYYTYFPSIQHRNYITRKTFQIFVRARSNFALHSIIDDQPHFSQNHSLEFPAFFPTLPANIFNAEHNTLNFSSLFLSPSLRLRSDEGKHKSTSTRARILSSHICFSHF